jgi:hypothetical protein
MSSAEEGRMSEGEQRVRVRARVVRRGDPLRPTTHLLRDDLREAERRFLLWQGGGPGIPPVDVLAEYLEILASLKLIYNQLQELSERRDSSYLADRRLNYLQGHCVWLTRRVSTEFLLVRQLHLERELRSAISQDAYQVFLRLEDVTDASREIETLGDRDLMARLGEGTLFREILERVPGPHPIGVAHEPAE